MYSEVIPMDTKARILALRLMERLRNDPAYVQSLGVEAALKKRLPPSIHSHLQTEGLTVL